MTFEGEGLASKDAHRGEKPPTVEEPSLTWRQASLLNWDDDAIMRYMSVNHDFLLCSTQQEAGAKHLLYLTAESAPFTCAPLHMFPVETKLHSYN